MVSTFITAFQADIAIFIISVFVKRTTTVLYMDMTTVILYNC